MIIVATQVSKIVFATLVGQVLIPDRPASNGGDKRDDTGEEEEEAGPSNLPACRVNPTNITNATILVNPRNYQWLPSLAPLLSLSASASAPFKDGVRGEKICHVEKCQISVHDR